MEIVEEQDHRRDACKTAQKFSQRRADHPSRFDRVRGGRLGGVLRRQAPQHGKRLGEFADVGRKKPAEPVRLPGLQYPDHLIEKLVEALIGNGFLFVAAAAQNHGLGIGGYAVERVVDQGGFAATGTTAYEYHG